MGWVRAKNRPLGDFVNATTVVGFETAFPHLGRMHGTDISDHDASSRQTSECHLFNSHESLTAYDCMPKTPSIKNSDNPLFLFLTACFASTQLSILDAWVAHQDSLQKPQVSEVASSNFTLPIGKPNLFDHKLLMILCVSLVFRSINSLTILNTRLALIKPGMWIGYPSAITAKNKKWRTFAQIE